MSTSTAPLVRPATAADMAAVTQIYAYEVLHGLATFEETPPDEAEMTSRFDALRAGGFPYLVAEIDGVVMGYAYAGPYRVRPAYRHSIESSVYVDAAARGRGVGRALLAGLVAACEDKEWSQMVAVIGNSENHGSIQLHAGRGFHVTGTLQAVGFKLGQWVDTVIMQRALRNTLDK